MQSLKPSTFAEVPTIYRKEMRILLFTLLTLTCLQVLSQPSISSFSPSSGIVGTPVVISGSGFNANPTLNIVRFGGVRATVTASSATSLTVLAPASASSPLTVTVANKTATAQHSFNITFAGGSIHNNAFIYNSAADNAPGSETNNLDYADINDDGKPDLVVCDRLNNTITVYPNSTAGSSITFGLKLDLSAGTNPYNLALGDVDADGNIDVVVSNRGSNSISIFRNTSSGGMMSFATRVDIAAAAHSAAIAIRDFDNDGLPDIAVQSIDLAGTVSFFRNTSSGSFISFANRIELAIGGMLNNIAAADFNVDGKADLVLTNFASNQIMILQNNSTPGVLSFSAAGVFVTGLYPEGLAVGDMNGDGKPEIAVATNDDGRVYVYENTTVAGISFAGTSKYIGSSPSDIKIAELDGDGKPDIVAMQAYSGFSILRNITTGGTLSFATGLSYGGYAVAERIAVYDIDGDGKNDISMTAGLARVLTWTNKSNLPYISSFTPTAGATGSTITINGFNFTGATAVSFGSVAATSFTVVSNVRITAKPGSGASGDVSVTNAYGAGSKAGFLYYPVPAIASFAPSAAGGGQTVTITGTGFLNVSAVSFGGIAASAFTVVNSTTITAVLGTGSTGAVSVTTPGGSVSAPGFTFIPPPVVSQFAPTSAGTNDVVTITGSNFVNVTDVFFGGTPALSYTVTSPSSITAIVAGGATGVVSVAGEYGSSTMAGFTFLRKNPPVINSVSSTKGRIGDIVHIAGTGFGSLPADNEVFFGGIKAVIQSANNNQIICNVPSQCLYAPIKVLNKITKLASVSKHAFSTSFQGSNTTQFAFHLDFPTGSVSSGVKHLSVADLNHDNKLDVVLVNNTDYKLFVQRNTTVNNVISFSSDAYNVAWDTWDVTTGDLDGDGFDDICVSSNLPNILSVFRNTSTPGGNITLAPKIELNTATNPQRIILHDLDGDGKPEIITANYWHGNISVFRNNSTAGVLSFAPKIDFTMAAGTSGIFIADLDNDGRPEIISCNANANTISVRKNISTGNIGFNAPLNFATGTQPGSVYASDFDGDDLIDIAVANIGQNSISLLRNITTSGGISFAPKQEVYNSYIVPHQSERITMNDMNGDGKADLLVSHALSPGTVTTYINRSTPGNISFSLVRELYLISGYPGKGLGTGDFNNDGKPDIVTSGGQGYSIMLNRSEIAPNAKINMCNGGSTSLTSEITGTYYIWQVFDSTGWKDLSNDQVYSGVYAKTLMITGAPSVYYGNEYRCKIGSTFTQVYKLRFENTWTGNINNSWENPGNWSCGIVPDANTDVIVPSGNCIISSNASVRSITAASGANVTVTAGYILNITH